MSNELSYFNLGGTNIPVCDEEARDTLQSKADKTYVDGLIAGVNNQLTGKLDKSSVVNNLTSTSASDPLSANMGRTLNEKVEQIYSDLSMNSPINASFRTLAGNDTFTVSKNGFYRFGIFNATSATGCAVTLLANNISQYVLDCLTGRNAIMLVYLYANTTYTVIPSGIADSFRLYDQ